MTALPLGEWIEGLTGQLSIDANRDIGAYLRGYRITPESVEPCLLLDANHYTRSLLFNTPLWQCVLMCWNAGQRTPVHDHDGHPAWVSLVRGRLGVRNFVVAPQQPDRSLFRIEESASLALDDGESECPAQAEASVHEVRNASSGSQYAVSVHLYGQPMASCGTYDPCSGRYRRVALSIDRNLSGQFAPAARELIDNPFLN